MLQYVGKCFCLFLISGLALAGSSGAPVNDNGHAAASGAETGVAPSTGAYFASLDRMLGYALENNAGLQDRHARWRSAVADADAAGALPDPVLSYSYYVREVETRVGSQRQAFGMSQPVPWFGKLGLRKDAAGLRAEAAFQELEAARLALVNAVRGAYADYWFLRRNVEITGRSLELLDAVEAIVRERYRAGHDMGSLVAVEIQKARLSDRLSELEGLRPALEAQLAALLNLPFDSSAVWPDDLPDAALEGAAPDFASISEEIRGSSPELLALGLEAGRRETMAGLARKGRFPDMVFDLRYIDTDTAMLPGTPDSGKDPVMATVAVTVPLHRGRVRAEEESALSMRDAALMQRRDKAAELVARARKAVYDCADGSRRIGLYSSAVIPKARQALALAEEEFRSGRAGLDKVIAAQRELLDFELVMLKARADRFRAWAELMMISGRDG